MDNNLKSLEKLQNDLNSAKLLSIFLPKKQREEIKKISNDLNDLLYQTKSFNDFFSDYGWCAYDSMSVDLMKKANEAFEKDGIDAGEKVLIEYYTGDVKKILHWIKNKAKPFMVRYNLLQYAFEDHFAGRYFSSVPQFLIIIDGAVNDYTKSKGFFAEGTDLDVWDCLVGCSDGLMKMKEIFNKGRNKTNNEEIRLPYRNGILHGRDLNYGNEYVSCKCISLMFALADWMNLKNTENERKEIYKKECNPPSLKESFSRLKNLEQDKEEQSKWQKREITVGVDISEIPSIEECDNYPYVVPIIEMFSFWQKRNYGSLSAVLGELFSYETSERKRAGECRELFGSKNLISYKLLEVEERGCSMSRILTLANWKDGNVEHSEQLEFGIVYMSDNKKIALPSKNNGTWIIKPWKIQGLYK